LARSFWPQDLLRETEGKKRKEKKRSLSTNKEEDGYRILRGSSRGKKAPNGRDCHLLGFCLSGKDEKGKVQTELLGEASRIIRRRGRKGYLKRKRNAFKTPSEGRENRALQWGETCHTSGSSGRRDRRWKRKTVLFTAEDL